jgi:outer membrane protein TolC
MRWKSRVGVLALALAAMIGCKQRIFLTEDQAEPYLGLIPSNLQNNPNVGAEPIVPPVDAPETLFNLEKFQIRYLSLAEAIATSLRQGTVGQPSLLFPGVGLDNEVQFTGRGVTGSDSIRVLAMDPATVGANLELSITKFDTLFITSMNWTTTDQPIGTTAATIQAAGSPITAIQQEQATFSSGFFKPLPTGGVAGITFNVPYTLTNLPARVNPAYQPQLQFQFEQPLLQGFGVEINQLRPVHPGSILNPLIGTTGNLGPTAEGILVSRIRFDQQRGEFERNINQMLLNVETAYWNLYGSYWALYSREQGVRFAFESWRLQRNRYEAGQTTPADVAQAQGQYELFRAQRLSAIDTVLDNERQLRALMGLPVADGSRLVPADAPTLALYQPDWRTALDESMSHRPELYMARQDIKANQLTVALAKNALLPDLRFAATYDDNSLGSRLDGSGQNNALRNLASNTFNDWSVQLRLTVPIGFRAANANLRQAQLQLSRSYLVLQDQELKTGRFLGLQYRRLSSTYEQIRANRAQRLAFGVQLDIRAKQNEAGRGTLDLLLEAQRFWADALAQEYAAIVSYQNALVGFEYAKGTIMQFNNVHIAEGPVPPCVQSRAVEHFRMRDKALDLRDHAAPTGALANKLDPVPTPGQNLPGTAPSLPQAWMERPPLQGAEPLPSPDLPPSPGAKSGPVELPRDEVLPPPGQLPPASDLPPAGAVQKPRHNKKSVDFATQRSDDTLPPLPEVGQGGALPEVPATKQPAARPSAPLLPLPSDPTTDR